MLLRDSKPWIAHGSMGGEIQPQIFMQVVSAIVDGGADIATALAGPRWAAWSDTHMGPPTEALLESRFSREVGRELESRGHRVKWAEAFDSALGHANAVELVPAGNGNQTLAAATDPRTEGGALAW
jgi:gamma-glutamyltranspeptidase/glutathione hydrolase